MRRYKIIDWAGNEIKKKKKDLWIELRFRSFQSAWNYIYTTFPDGENAEWDDLYVEEA